MEERAHLAELLRTRSLKATSTRLEVLSVISEYEKAIPFSEIQQVLNDFDRVTLYRTIQALIENGIIHKALIDENETYYALCNKHCTSDCHQHKHVHFKCTRCHEVTCVETAQPIIISIQGYSIESFEVEATGICASCAS